MSQFVILLYDQPGSWAQVSPEDMQKAIQKYWAWGEKMRAEGRLIGKNKLTTEGRVMRGHNKVHVTDGPYTEGKEVLGGYYIFEADNYDHAVELSRDHPHLEHGIIEVREVEVLPHS